VWNSSRRKKRGAFIFSSATVFPAMFKLIYNSNNDQKVPQSHDHNNGPRIPHEPYEPPFVVTTFGIVFITSHNIHTKYTCSVPIYMYTKKCIIYTYKCSYQTLVRSSFSACNANPIDIISAKKQNHTFTLQVKTDNYSVDTQMKLIGSADLEYLRNNEVLFISEFLRRRYLQFIIRPMPPRDVIYIEL
jgi:hypothetical protein